MQILGEDLRVAVKAIKKAILQSQYQAAKSVNREQLSLYFGIGRYISEHSRDGYWGTGAITAISEHLQKELPGLRGFGAANIMFMRQFYEEWQPYFDSMANNHAKSLTTDSENKDDAVEMDLLIPSNCYPTMMDGKCVR